MIPVGLKGAFALSWIPIEQGRLEVALPLPEPTAVVRAAPPGERPKVALCMIVKNEEANLPACLGSVADLVDEVIVVDTGSTDAAKAVAARFGAKVCDFPWVDDFGAARQGGQALSACRAGLALFPEDVELLFQEGVILRGLGDAAGAEAAWLKVLETPPGDYFASMATGLRGHLTRHNLAALCRAQGRDAEAEEQWRAALAERPDYEPAWRGLSDLLLSQQRWQEVEALAAGLEGGPEGAVRAASVRGRGHLARREFAAGRHLLEYVSGGFPEAVEPRRLLSYVLLQEGEDWEAAERALRDVLAIDPGHAEARQNLTVLLRQQGKLRPRS